MSLVSLTRVTLALGGPALLDCADLRIAKGERVCLMGRNGEGKSTLLGLLAGERSPDTGEVIRARDLRVGLLPQQVPAGLGGTVFEVVAGGLGATPDQARDPAWSRRHEAAEACNRAELDPDADFATLSTGRQRRALLARALADAPQLLLLDEPTNHLDIDAIEWLEGVLGRFDGAVVFVTHDRAFLRRTARRIVELDRGRLRDWTCGYDEFLRRRDEALRVEADQQAEFDRKLAQEEVWIRQGVRERRTRNEGRVRALLKMRDERRARRERQDDASFRIQEAERSGRLVLRTEDLSFGYGADPIVSGLTTTVVRGDRIGLVGRNGCGKTTLIKLLLGELSPTSGTIRHGANLETAYYDQRRDTLDDARTVLENVTGGNDTVNVGGRQMHAVTYLKQFLFTPDRARTPITHLSGGERNRLLLARLFTRPANLLILDEPTNDLDLETLELLEELLGDFAGTVLLVSHDREFLDRVCTGTLVFTGDGQVEESVGGWSDWEKVRRTGPRKAPRTAKPKPSRPVADKPRRLTWKEGKELEALPARIEEAEAALDEIRTTLADPALYRDGGADVADLRGRMEGAESDLAVLYARWEELETIREAQN